MRIAITFCIFFCIMSCLAHWSVDDYPSFTESEKLKTIANNFWQQTLEESPTWATFIGYHQFDNDLPDISPTSIQKRIKNYQSLLSKLEKINSSKLTIEEQITTDVLLQELINRIHTKQCKNWLWVVDQLDGYQVIFAELPNYHSILSIKDADALINRYSQMKTFYEQHISNLKEGISQGYLPARINVELVIKQLNRQLNETPENTPYYQIIERLPNEFSAEEKKQLQDKLSAVIKNSIHPGLLAYRNFLQNVLLSKARPDVSIRSIPQGEDCYLALIQTHTGLQISAKEIHQLGLQEVSRIQTAMNQLIHEFYPKMNFESYKKLLRQKAKHKSISRKDLLQHNQKLIAKAQAVLPRAFSKIPQTPIEVKSIEEFREQEAPAAYYYEAPTDGSRPAFYYLNTYDSKNRSLHNMAVLAFHESIPGHHLQIALANENQSLPEFQRQLGQTAFIEGWALYAESLSEELGLYENMDESLSALNYELWRAVRLVIDTGIHHLKWSRQQAIDYLSKETSLPKAEVTNEIDRYIAWPGQALAYKIGQLEILKTRKEAEQKLGKKFSLTAFHDRLLQFGAVPLPTMQRNIANWINEQQSSATHHGIIHLP